MGGKYRAITIKKVIDNVNVRATGSSNSDPILIAYAEHFSYVIEVSGTTPRIKLDYQIIASPEGDPDNVSSIHDGEVTWYTPVTNGNLVAEVSASQADGFSPAVSRWLRIQVTGTATNHANDTYVTVYIMYQ